MELRHLCILFILITFSAVNAQTPPKKKLRAVVVENPMTINGILDEPEWQTAPSATGFIMSEPDNGVPISSDKQVEVKILYTNTAIYIGALLRDPQPHLIQKEITQRDRFGVSDHFGVYINGFNDGQQDFRFFVSAAGVQMDCLATETGEDYSWDAIWDSAVAITEEGWVVEMEIPYAALRFPKAENQIWGINFYRELRRDRQKYFWNPVDARIGAIIPQAGILEGITNIKPPTRLFLIPYSSFYAEKNQLGSDYTFKGGMDIKYGINDSFTLDAILIPDFGQAAFDDVILNLGPFEQQFNENRPFFTEGTDIFNKGDLLYTRRIGGPPSRRAATGENEIVERHPATVNLLNATKISGRTGKGLGIGVLNALTERSLVTVRNTETGETRRVEVEPLTNYNVTVLDQRFNQNSSIAFINTNVWRGGNFRDANVSALVYDLNTTANTYNLSGDFKYSYINHPEIQTGISTFINIGKTFGKYRYSLSSSYVSKDYEINDLGINFITNYHTVTANANYRILNPVKWFNTFRLNTTLYTEMQNTTGRLQDAFANIGVNSNTRKNDYIGYGVNIKPYETYDFYEPREDGRFLSIPRSIGSWIYFSSNYNRKFAFDIEPSFTRFDQDNRYNFDLWMSPRYRFSDRFSLIYSFTYLQQKSDIGWVDRTETDIILAERNRNTYIQSIQGKYALNEKMTLNLVARYYWSYAENIRYHNLLDDGSFTQNENYTINQNSNFALWNFDISYSWWFAPGSEISVLYRNNAQNFSQDINKNFSTNVSGLFENHLNHIFSISIRYFVDYNKLKNWI